MCFLVNGVRKRNAFRARRSAYENWNRCKEICRREHVWFACTPLRQGDPICLVFRSFDPIFGMACFGDLGLFTAVQLGRANYVLTAPP